MSNDYIRRARRGAGGNRRVGDPGSRHRRVLIAVVALLLGVVGLPGVSSASIDNKGTEFFFGFLPNLNTPNVELHLTSEVATTVDIEYPIGVTHSSVAVSPGSVTIVSLPAAAAQGWSVNTAQANLVRASAPGEFVAYMVNRAPFTSDAALGLPVDSMNTDYIVTDYNASCCAQSEFVVYAAFDNTTATITPATDATGHLAGVPFDVILDRGEGYLVQSVSSGTASSLTGSTVKADRPVGVTNGHVCINIPSGTAACDHVFEVAQPVQSWGTEIGVANLPQRPGGSVYRVVASADSTTVTMDGAPLASLDRGQFFETAVIPGNHVFRGDKPIYVVQFMTGVSYPGAVSGDPAQGNMIPFAQYLNGYTFSTVGGSQFVTNYVTIIAANADVGSLLLDGVAVPAGDFTPIPTTGFSAAVVPLTDGTHTTSSTSPHGITVEGYNQADSYIYPGGALFQFINPAGDTNAPIVSLDPPAGDPPSVNGTATDDRPSEDTNGDGVLDPGEDLNGNGLIDEDTGIFFVQLGSGSTNLTLTTAPFVPGDGSVGFVVSLTDPSLDGTGTVEVTDGAGNVTTVPVTINVVNAPPPSDTTGPVCELVAASSSGLTVRSIDPDSGLASIVVTRAKNANVVVPVFTPGTNDEQIVTATKIKSGAGASVQLEVTDMDGNSTVCDPVIAKLASGDIETFHGVPAEEHFFTVSEADGVAAVVVEAAGVSHVIWSPDGRTVDLGSVGDGTVTVRVLGTPGSVATIMLWDGKG